MASPLGSVGVLDVQTDESGSTIPICISETAGIVSEGLALSTWGAAFVLANSLYKIDVPSEASRLVLELGAGTGLVGLTAAMLWRSHVTLTDLPPVVPGVAANVVLNSELLAQHKSSATCASLDWASPGRIGSPVGLSGESATVSLDTERNRPGVILAADTIYTEEHPALLVSTIESWLAPGPHARVIVCYPLRMAYMDHIRDFWARMEAAGLECEREGREDGVEEWNEVASTPFEWCVWRWREQ